MKHLHYLLFLSLITFFVPEITLAQNSKMESKPRKRANANKSWQFESYTVLEKEYKMSGYLIRYIPRAAQDSVYLYDIEKGKKLLSSFPVAKDGRILNPLSLEYPEDRRPYIDSIVPDMKGNSRKYFDQLLYTDGVRMTQDMFNGFKRYYDSRGQDSLYYVHYPDDSMLLISWFRDGKDSLHRRWNAKGTLIYEESGRITQRWNDEQKLIEKTFDTLIQGNTVECIKSWYPSGVLESVRYYYFDVACLSWEYYSEQGKLVRLVRKKRLDEISPEVYAFDPPPIRAIEVRDEEVTQVFKQELNRKLSELLYRTKGKPEGTYQVQVWLEASGKLKLNKLDGEYADVIGPDIDTIFSELSGARPAKRNGRPYAQLLQLTLKVSDKGE